MRLAAPVVVAVPPGPFPKALSRITKLPLHVRQSLGSSRSAVKGSHGECGSDRSSRASDIRSAGRCPPGRQVHASPDSGQRVGG